MKVSVDIHSALVDGDYGSFDGLRVCCSRCGHEVEVPGTELARRGMQQSSYEKSVLVAKITFMMSTGGE